MLLGIILEDCLVFSAHDDKICSELGQFQACDSGNVRRHRAAGVCEEIECFTVCIIHLKLLSCMASSN